MAKTKLLICPYCGETQPARDRCRSCGGHFEPESRQASHNAMGPWFCRNPDRPFQPGCSYETLALLIERGQVSKYSIIRGPTTRQFWTIAKHVPGVAHLLGYCHACDAEVSAGELGCPACGVPFGAYLDRNYLGLPDVRPLPWEAPGGHDPDDSAAGFGSAAPYPSIPTPGRISSFATDAELRGVSNGDPAVREAVVPPRSSDRSDHHPRQMKRRHGAGDSAAEADAAATPSVRALQRRLDRQQRTIRFLTVLIVVIAVAGAIFNVVSVAGRNRAEVKPANQTAGPAVSPGDDGTSGNEPTGSTVPPRAVVEADAATEPEQESAPAAPVEPATVVGPTSVLPAELAKEYEQALGLAAQADDAERPREDRITDYEAALRILQRIASTFPEDEQPEAVLAHIRRIEDAVEILRLKEFYP